MIFPGIFRIARELNLKRTKDHAVGIVKNCHVCLYDGSSVKIVDMKFPSVTPEFAERVKGKLKGLGIKRIEWIENLLRITFFELLWPYPVEKIKVAVLTLGALSQQTFPDQYVLCNSCKNSTLVETYYAANSIYVLCPSCAESVKSDFRSSQKIYSETPPRYIEGMLGGLVCSLPGVLVAAILFVFLSRIAALSSLLYVFLAMWGYTKLRGKTDLVGAGLILAIGVIMTVGGTAIAYIANLSYQTKDLGRALQLLARRDISNEMQVNIVLALVVSSFYFVFQFYELSKNWKFPKLEKAYNLKY